MNYHNMASIRTCFFYSVFFIKGFSCSYFNLLRMTIVEAHRITALTNKLTNNRIISISINFPAAPVKNKDDMNGKNIKLLIWSFVKFIPNSIGIDISKGNIAEQLAPKNKEPTIAFKKYYYAQCIIRQITLHITKQEVKILSFILHFTLKKTIENLRDVLVNQKKVPHIAAFPLSIAPVITV